MESSVQIGGCRFFPERALLETPDGPLTLPDRAARLLDLLCERRGQVVARQDILDRVWNGRAVSENSLAIVVSDLRKALGDTGRDLIETIPKRGYRLAPEASGQPVRQPLAVPALAVAALLAIISLVVGIPQLLLGGAAPAGDVVVTINNVRNLTGDTGLDPLARAISEQGAAYLHRAGAPILVRDRWDFSADDPSRNLREHYPDATRIYHLSSTIVTDGAQTRLVMLANNPVTNEVLWSHETDLAAPIDSEAILEAALGDFLGEIGVDPPDRSSAAVRAAR